MHTRGWIGLVAVTCLVVLGCMSLSLALAGEVIEDFLGIVEGGQFLLLAPTELPWIAVGLTAIAMQEAVPPEMRELDLLPYEGLAVVVRGRDGGGWIYRAEIAEVASPLLTRFIREFYQVPPCLACLARLSSATHDDFRAISGIERGTADSLVDAQPFVLSLCRSRADIEQLLDEVPGVGSVLRVRIVKHFCPDLYE